MSLLKKFFSATIATATSSLGLWLWGLNTNGQLGNNAVTNKSSPVQTVAGGSTWAQSSAGLSHVAAVKTDGTLWMWGSNASGQLGDNSTTKRSSPVQTVAGGTAWAQVSCGQNFTAAIKTAGTLWTWGTNTVGQLGDNTIVDKSSPVQTVAGGTAWSQIACGSAHSAAIKTDGTLWTWGSNTDGQLGDNSATNRSSPVQTVAAGTTWKAVACGANHTAAVKTDGTLWTWGLNTNGQLGDNSITARSSPVQTVAGGSLWTKVACGLKHTAAIKTDGTLWLWGKNGYGQLGNNASADKSSPVQTVAAGTTWYQAGGGYGHTVAVKTDGTLWTWGLNDKGQLGDSSVTNRSSPVQTIAGGSLWSQVATDGAVSKMTLGITNGAPGVSGSGALWTWGRNTSGQLGDNTITLRSSPVQTITGGTTWKQVACGGEHAAAIKTDGTLWGWGANSYGQLGDGAVTNKSSPVQTMAGGTTWSQVAGGYYHTAAVKTDGTLWSWGLNTDGQLGNNSTFGRSSPVQTVAGGTNWKSVACGTRFTAAVKTDGTLWSWGYNVYGQLGDNSRTERSSPVQTVAGGTSWQSVACGALHTVAIKTDGTLWGWGLNSYGQLGDNSSTNRSSPVQTVAGGSTWKQAACGYHHTAAIKTDGTLWLWGRNTDGQLGDNTITKRSSPVQTIAAGTTWKAVACGLNHTAAIKTDGTLWLWGKNVYGHLGDNSATSRSSPVQTVAGGTTWKTVACGDQDTLAVA